MIERLLAAEAALARDELDHAQRLFGQVAEADPRNAIAVVGLARVLTRRGDTDTARELLAHALEIDPDEAAAGRLLAELNEAEAGPFSAETTAAETVAAPALTRELETAGAPPTEPAPADRAAPSRRAWVDRLLGWLGLRGRV
jgi:thioredoxin-like negative regulator of GroEL